LESAGEKDAGKQETENTAVLEPEHDVDQVEEEEEEGPANAVDGAFEEDEQETEDASDPFEVRFANPDNNLLSRRLKALEKRQWTIQKSSLPKVGKAIICVPDETGVGDSIMPAAISSPAGLKLKQKLAISFTKQITTFDPLEQSVAPFIFNYNDILFCERNPANSERLCRLTCGHAVNHIFKYDLSSQLLLFLY
jgi:U3 small nucleolar RNA-associated protein 25